MSASETIAERARAVLLTADPREKAWASRAAAQAWQAGHLAFEPGRPPAEPMPERPGRLEKPELLPPGQMPKRRTGGLEGRVALLHALAHIELNAVNLAWDMAGRFGHEVADRRFIDDWVRVGDDEARHFLMLSDRLHELGAVYGDLPAHDGLWEAAEATTDDVIPRLAVVPLVLEARGLDVCPEMIRRLEKVGDEESAAILRVILHDEISHVRIGVDWLHRLCAVRGLVLPEAWQAFVRDRFKGVLKRPFNEHARTQAGLPKSYYEPLAGA